MISAQSLFYLVVESNNSAVRVGDVILCSLLRPQLDRGSDLGRSHSQNGNQKVNWLANCEPQHFSIPL